LKRIEDALEIRRRILLAFEQAEATSDTEERSSLLTFLIVGGGPTGVELAGAIAELARFGMEKEFRTFDPAAARVILVQSAPRLLPAFPEYLATIASVHWQNWVSKCCLEAVSRISRRRVSPSAAGKSLPAPCCGLPECARPPRRYG